MIGTSASSMLRCTARSFARPASMSCGASSNSMMRSSTIATLIPGWPAKPSARSPTCQSAARPLPPAHAKVLAEDPRGRPALWQIGKSAFGFAGHPGLKVAMVEDLIMEFAEAPPDPGAELAKLRAATRAMEDALVPIMTGLVQLTGWTHSLGPVDQTAA